MKFYTSATVGKAAMSDEMGVGTTTTHCLADSLTLRIASAYPSPNVVSRVTIAQAYSAAACCSIPAMQYSWRTAISYLILCCEEPNVRN